ncbi:hypothetical protein HN51_002827 [Arachis hypogaea]|uniref:RING-type domain-containing protein n=2 Tax=Arachis TaxID=3817 RepID=A0A445EL12_ARAHY|nr:uncharacterized protein LOC107467445 [Arachis duranensis]QHO51073.1 Zinc finger, C3HC4 type (RING finger) protein [Arachis hypogaea]RYR76147.1 hypothetical protein Ahy_A01g000745 [Arachis hypogaea]
MSQLGMMLQESLRAETEARTILGLLTDQMDGVVHTGQRRRRTLKDRFRFTGMGCCGATWVFRPSPLTLTTHAAHQQEAPEAGAAVAASPPQETDPGQDPNRDGPECERPSTGMNLAAALAAERELRGSQEEGERDVVGSETPWRMSLMRLLEETEGGGGRGGGGDSEEGGDWVCCVCMGRKKGAAFIPCGHTFCRVCCREVWLNRGTCPLCNRSILEILDIF